MPLGRPVRIDWDVPPGMALEALAPSDGWSVLSTDDSGAVIVPLALDTLPLPPLAASGPADSILLDPPVIVVQRTMPDSSWAVTPFPAPLFMDIPPGLPRDYLIPLMFWESWGGPASSFPFVPVAAAVLAAACLAFLAARRRRGRGPGATGPGIAQSRRSTLSEMALALLDSPHLASGDFTALYREIDLILRRVVERRFGLDMAALTYRQARSALGDGAADFFRGTSDLEREISLQRYAGWGTTRDRASSDIRRLSSIAAEAGE